MTDNEAIDALLARKPYGSKSDRSDYCQAVPCDVLFHGLNAVERLRTERDDFDGRLYRCSMDLGVAQSTINSQAKEIQRLRDEANALVHIGRELSSLVRPDDPARNYAVRFSEETARV